MLCHTLFSQQCALCTRSTLIDSVPFHSVDNVDGSWFEERWQLKRRFWNETALFNLHVQSFITSISSWHAGIPVSLFYWNEIGQIRDVDDSQASLPDISLMQARDLLGQEFAHVTLELFIHTWSQPWCFAEVSLEIGPFPRDEKPGVKLCVELSQGLCGFYTSCLKKGSFLAPYRSRSR